MHRVDSTNETHYVRRFLTALLGVPLATEEMEEEDVQGTLTLWFHEVKDKDGNPSNKVYGVSNCHVLRRNTTVDYEHRGPGAPRNHVRVDGMRRFQRGLDEIKMAVAGHGISAEVLARRIVRLQAEERQDAENAREIRAIQRKLTDKHKAIADRLEALYNEVTKHWSDIKLHRNIGYVQYAPAITVDVEGGTLHTSDWAAFLTAEAKVKDEFEGNVVDLGAFRPIFLVFTSSNENTLIQRLSRGPITFEFPSESKLQIEGCATKEDLANPTEFDSEAQRCLIVGKDGNATDLTFGRYAGLVSFVLNEVGIESVELGTYNSDDKIFSAKGNLGALVWHTTNDGKARIVGQLHSVQNKGGSTSKHVTYYTPGWYLLDQIKKRLKYAEFYRTTWSA
ncbi:hypothetical protein H0H81_005076 [Sphagnurus paluster]|uniref:Uncharacterized protein n=1 Tax=Sphagnurus paluster TaxID=117069 RepID=A0A9P7KEK7_9AGAR|nr:hypothetical protein H0H81_005076 [Sphagnurus paluster]